MTNTFRDPSELIAHIHEQIRANAQEIVIYDYNIDFNFNFISVIQFTRLGVPTEGNVGYTINKPIRFGCEFLKYANFEGVTYKSKADFKFCIFRKDTNFRSSTFESKVDFKGCKFFGNVDFRFTAFHSDSIFEKVFFGETANFEGIVLNENGNLDFTNANVDKLFILGKQENGEICLNKSINLTGLVTALDSVVRIRNINNHENLIGELICKDAFIKGLFDIQKIYLHQIDFSGATITGNINEGNVLYSKIANRETARILKNEALKVNNNILALEYKAQELQSYKSEAKTKKETKFLIWLNSLSNDNGLCWSKGLLFTILCWIGFYLLFLCTTRIDGIIVLLKGNTVEWTVATDIANGISFLWSLDFLNTLTEWISTQGITNSTAWFKIPQIILAILFFILGKIAVGYGIFQTISAFRKYGKE